MAVVDMHHPGKVAALRPRVTWRDAIVIAGAVIAFLIGLGIKTWHDERVSSATIDGVSISYPRTWVRLPGFDPVQFRAVSTSDPLTSMSFGLVEANQPDVVLAAATTPINPARSQTAYIAISSQATTVDGVPAMVTEYAYVNTVAGGTAPVVVRGEEYNWLQNGLLYSLAIESSAGEWEHERDRVGNLIDRVRLSG
jgi:hypothetical protein